MNVYFVSQVFYRRSLIERLHWALRKQLMSQAMRELTVSVEALTTSIREQFMPAMDECAFAFQRFTVDMLLAEPWHRHLRLRWSLRHSRQWVTSGKTADKRDSQEGPQ